MDEMQSNLIIKQVSARNFELLHQTLLSLSDLKKLIIQLNFYDELSICQISRALKISRRKVDELIRTALIELRKKLQNIEQC